NHKQRPMLVHDVLRGKDLERSKKNGNPAACKNTQRTEQPKEMQRPRHVLQQKPDRQQVKEYAKRPSDPVMRFSALAMHILDRNLADARPVPRRQRWNESVHLPVERDIVNHLTPIRLERRAEIVN